MKGTMAAIVMALVIGIAAGAAGAYLSLQPQLAEVREALAQAEDLAGQRQGEADAAQAKLAALEARLEAEQRRMARLQGDLAQQEQEFARLEQASAEVDASAVMPEMPQDEEMDLTAFLATLRDEVQDDEEDSGRRGWGNMTEEERQEMRQNFAQRMRENVSSFYAEQASQSRNPATQERMAAMNDYTQHLYDLMGQMRDAETDEERQAVQSELRQTVETLQTLRQEQQQELLGRVATRYGIEDPQQQQQFGQTVQRVLQSPFFRNDPLAGGMFGGGGFGGRGGFGGGGGPGGGPPR